MSVDVYDKATEATRLSGRRVNVVSVGSGNATEPIEPSNWQNGWFKANMSVPYMLVNDTTSNDGSEFLSVEKRVDAIHD